MAKPRPRWEKVSGQCIQHRIKQVHRTELPLVASASKFVNKAPVTGDVWYVGGITDWTARDIEVDCSFLGDKSYNATLFKDGVNAHRNGRDYKCESFPVKKGGKLKVHLAPGGGFALKIK